MAEIKNNAPAKFDKDALIKWLNLSDLSERWGCKTADLIHYAAQGKLCLSVIADYWYLDYWMVQNKDLIKHHREICQDDLLRIDAGVAKKLELKGAATVDRARWAENETFAKVAVISPEFSKNHPGGYASPEAPPDILIKDIVVSADELIRFEKEHGINQPNPRDDERPPAETSNDKIYRLHMEGKTYHAIKHALRLEITPEAIRQRFERERKKRSAQGKKPSTL